MSTTDGASISKRLRGVRLQGRIILVSRGGLRARSNKQPALHCILGIRRHNPLTSSGKSSISPLPAGMPSQSAVQNNRVSTGGNRSGICEHVNLEERTTCVLEGTRFELSVKVTWREIVVRKVANIGS